MRWVFGECFEVRSLSGTDSPPDPSQLAFLTSLQQLVLELSSLEENFESLRDNILKMEAYKLGKVIEN